MIILFYLFGASLAGVFGFQPNCDPYNQFRYFCFSVEYCERFKCDSDTCGEYTRNTRLVKLHKTKIIPKCAFTNSESLEIIDGRNSEIEVLASGSFINLTADNLQIDLAFNSIKELHSGIFENVHATHLNLSWNKILYIQEGAFMGLPKLEHLNLSRNELATFPIHRLPLQLKVLDFSYNLLDRALLTSKRMPSLAFIDFSNNKINKVAFSMENPIKTINLTNNLLKKFDLIEFPSCDELHIGQNNFTNIPKALTYLNLKKISLYPNPWKCNDLQKLWKKLLNNYVTLSDDAKSETSALCSASPSSNGWSSMIQSRGNFFDNDLECGSDMVCRGHHCWDPCRYNICDPGEECLVQNHKLKCFCPEGTRKDPMLPYFGCQNVECFTENDCPEDKYCSDDNKCHFFQAYIPLSTQIPSMILTDTSEPGFHNRQPVENPSFVIVKDPASTSFPDITSPPTFNFPTRRFTTKRPAQWTSATRLPPTRLPTGDNDRRVDTDFNEVDKDNDGDEWWRYEIPKSLKETENESVVN